MYINTYANNDLKSNTDLGKYGAYCLPGFIGELVMDIGLNELEMPTRPSKPCRYPGCPNLVKKENYCPDHVQHDTSKFRNKKGKTHPWYLTKFWKDLRLLKLKRNPLCEYHEEKGELISANTVDHKTDWKTGRNEEERWKLFSDYDNLASSCTSCHNSKTGRTNK